MEDIAREAGSVDIEEEILDSMWSNFFSLEMNLAATKMSQTFL